MEQAHSERLHPTQANLSQAILRSCSDSEELCEDLDGDDDNGYDDGDCNGDDDKDEEEDFTD